MDDMIMPGYMALVVRAEKGDTYTTIANQFGVEVEVVQAANVGIKIVREGSELVVPLIPSQCSTEEGDTMESVAAQFGIDLERLQAMNPKVTELTPGTVLNIP